MIAYKVLRDGAIEPFSERRWPAPEGASPGEWLAVTGQLRPGDDALPAFRLRDLPYWINHELWVAELGDEVAEFDRLVLARRARLLRRVDAWDRRTALAFSEACAQRVRDYAAGVLRGAGLSDEANALERAPSLEAQRDAGIAASEAATAAGLADAATAAGYAADAAVFGLEPQPATVTFIGAHAAAIAAGEARAVEASHAERAWQAGWLKERLGLEDA